jgi:hypothetical protein
MFRRAALLSIGLAACTDYGFKGWDDRRPGDHADTAAPPSDPAGDPPDAPETDDPPDTGAPPMDTGDPPSGDLGGLRGRICDPSGGSWVVGALVYAWVDLDGDGVSDSRRSDVTDGDGRFGLSDLPPGLTTVFVEKGSFTAEFDATVVAGMVTNIPVDTCLDRDSVNIAVVTGDYDDIGAILTGMTIPYTRYNGIASTDYVDFLRDPVAMAGFDIIFINCGQHTEWWPHAYEVGTNLRDYVLDGGNLYVSDWAYYMLEMSFPDLMDFYGDDTIGGAAAVGAPGELTGEVVDPHMQALLGTSIADLNFDYNAWAIPESVGPDTTVLVRGAAPIEGSSHVVSNAPLAGRAEPAGSIIYTAFHNESQATIDMETLLQEIVLSL